MAFDILADIIARASGLTFEAYMKENIFKSLEMKNSTFKLPISVPVTKMLTKEGAKAAVELYHQLKKNKPDNYYFREQELNPQSDEFEKKEYARQRKVLKELNSIFFFCQGRGGVSPPGCCCLCPIGCFTRKLSENAG